MADKKITLSVAEVSITGGRKKTIRINVDGRDVGIPVDDSIYAYWKEQFFRNNPTPQQKKRFATMMNVVRAAYIKGLVDRKN